MVGEKLQGRYAVETKLAAGGMGAVFVATDERLGRRVALKVLKETLSSDPSFVERFRREARAVAALSHPNVAGVYDFGRDGERHFMVMELVEGKDLARVLREEGPLPQERALAMAEQIASALGHAHAAGIVHRDVKPANVIVATDERVKVTDFGIARALGDATLTATGSVLGTAHYLSPEQASGKAVGPPTDVYALGVMLYEMLTGSVPFTGDSPIAIAMRHVSDEIPPPSDLNPGVSAALDRVVERATGKDPSERYSDGGEFAAALAGEMRAGADEAVAPTAALAGASGATPGEWPIPGGRWDPQRLGRIVLVTFIALVLIAAGLLAMRLGARDAATGRDERGGGPAAGPATPSPTPTGPVLPDLIGDNVKDAEKRLKDDMDLEVDKEEIESDAPKDQVVRMSPRPGTPVQPGHFVTLYYSEGPDDDDERGRGRGRGENRGKGKGNDD